MKQKFEKPVCETISFGNDVIKSSGCSCVMEGIDIGGCDNNICTSINTYCDCQSNYVDKTKENCINI